MLNGQLNPGMLRREDQVRRAKERVGTGRKYTDGRPEPHQDVWLSVASKVRFRRYPKCYSNTKQLPECLCMCVRNCIILRIVQDGKTFSILPNFLSIERPFPRHFKRTFLVFEFAISKSTDCDDTKDWLFQSFGNFERGDGSEAMADKHRVFVIRCCVKSCLDPFVFHGIVGIGERGHHDFMSHLFEFRFVPQHTRPIRCTLKTVQYHVLVLFIIIKNERKIYLCTLGAADPDALRLLYLFAPVESCEVVDKSVSVVGDLEIPLQHLPLLHHRVAPLALPFHHLLVGEYGLILRAPIDRRLLAVCEPGFEQL